MPYLPLTLSLNGQSLNTEGLLDTGTSVNVLPYDLGLQLDLIWEDETLSVLLAGNLARFEARAVVVGARVSSFPMINLAFAWTQANDVPLILGQANFFFEFDVCFFRACSELKFALNTLSSTMRTPVVSDRQCEILNKGYFEVNSASNNLQ